MALGMKAYTGVDAATGLARSLGGTAANLADVTQVMPVGT